MKINKEILNKKTNKRINNSYFKKIFASIILLIMILSNVSNLIVYAAEIEKTNELKTEIKNKTENKTKKIDVKIKNEKENQEFEKIQTKVKEDFIVKNNNIPTNYELGVNDNTKVNKYYQEQLGLCWAFTAINLMETSAQKLLGKKNEPNISRRHIDYLSSSSVSNNPYMTGRDINTGSTLGMGEAYGINGSGIAYEKDFPFHYDNKRLTANDLNLPKVPYEVTGFENFTRIVKRFDGQRIKYYTDGNNGMALNDTQIKSIRNRVKAHIMEKGGVGTKIYAIDGKDFYSGTGNHLFIHPSRPITVNHAVTIVGWDDNISKENFKDYRNKLKPQHDGAWIVEDTRGGMPRSVEKENTRYYVSYDSVNIESSHWTGITEMRNVDIKKEGLYKTKSWGTNTKISMQSTSDKENQIEMIKVFTKENDIQENIKGVGIYVEEPVDVQLELIPKLNITGKIVDAVNNVKSKGLSQKYTLTTPGYKYIEFPTYNSIIEAKKGEKFAIKFRFSSQSSNLSIPIEVKDGNSMTLEMKKMMAPVKFNLNEDFMALRTINKTHLFETTGIFESLYGNEGKNVSYISGVSPEKRFICNLYTNYGDYVRVNFDLDGGEGDINFQSIPRNSKVVLPKNPYKKGYVFKGWTPDINQIITEPITFKANWEKVNDIYYNVSFDLSGGDILGQKTVDSIKVKQGEKAKPPVAPTKEGYIFAGWSPDINKEIYEDTTFIAKWTKNIEEKIVIKFILAGGNIDGNIMVPAQYLEKGKTYQISMKDPQREGYKFIGWNPDIRIPVSEDTTYIAKWQSLEDLPEKYTVSFDLNGGWGVFSDREVDSGTVLDKVGIPERDKYNFMGWTPDITQPITQNTVFKANWQLKEVGFTLKFNIPGKSDLIKVIPYGEKPIDYLKPEEINPIREGYNFKGWNVDLEKPLTTENTSIMAEWELKATEKHTIYFYTMPGKLYKKQEVKAGENISEELLKEIGTPTRQDHEFIAWDFNFSEKINEDKTIFAKWKIELKPEIEIKFNLNGGKFFLTENQIYKKKRDESFNNWLDKLISSFGISKEEKIPKKVGYTFVCWVDEENNVRYPHTKELKNKYNLKAVWADGSSGIITNDIINEIYDPVNPNDEKNIVNDDNKPNKPGTNPEDNKKPGDQNPNPEDNKKPGDQNPNPEDNKKPGEQNPNPEDNKNPGDQKPNLEDNKNPDDQNKKPNNNETLNPNENGSNNNNNLNNTNTNNLNNNANKPNNNFNYRNNNNDLNKNYFSDQKSDTKRMSFYDPIYEEKKSTNDKNKIQIKNNSKETTDKNKKQINKDIPYAGLSSNLKIILVFTLLGGITIFSYYKIIKLKKSTKINIY